MFLRPAMPACLGRVLLVQVVAAMLAAAPVSASATPHHFDVGGWDTGGLLQGTFTGDDLNGDGFISSFDGEVSSFAASFAGSSSVAAFSFSTGDLKGLVYRADGGPLGNDLLPLSEGVHASSGSFELLSGVGVAGLPGSLVFDLVANTSAVTNSLMAVSAVPEPQGVVLMLGGLALVGAAARARLAQAAGPSRGG